MKPRPCPQHRAPAGVVQQADTVRSRQKREPVTTQKKCSCLRVWTAAAAAPVAASGKSPGHCEDSLEKSLKEENLINSVVVFLCAATADAPPVAVTALRAWKWVTFLQTHTAEMTPPNYTQSTPPPDVVSGLT